MTSALKLLILLAFLAPGEALWAQLVTSDARTDLRAFANRWRAEGDGVLLTPAIGNVPPENQKIREYLQGVVDKLGESAPETKEMHIRVNLYSGQYPNAAANRPELVEDASKHLPRFLGFAADGKPIYEIIVFRGVLKMFRSEDELAFVLAHELGHVVSKHLDVESKKKIELARNWFNSQANELEADLFALKALKGRYDLDAGYEFMERFIQGGAPASPGDIFLRAHHHPSVRLAAMLAKIQEMRRSDPAAAARHTVALPRGLLGSRGTTRENPKTENFAPVREAYFKWFDNFLRERPATPWNAYALKPSEIPGVQDATLYADAMNEIFRDSLRRIETTPGLSREEKLGRIFEFISLFRLWHTHVEPDAVRDAVKELGARERKALDGTLRRVLSARGDPWTPDGVMRSIARRLEFRHPHSKELFSIHSILEYFLRTPEYQEVFAPLQKSSTKLAEFFGRINRIEDVVDFRLFWAAADRALRDPPPPPDQLAKIYRHLETFSFQEAYADPERFDSLRGLAYELKEKLEKCGDGEACRKVKEFYARLEPEIKSHLQRTVRSAMALDPKSADKAALEAAFKDVGEMLSAYKRVTLDPEDFRAQRLELWTWYKSLRGRPDVELHHQADYALGKVFELGLLERAWQGEDAFEVYRTIVRNGNMGSMDAYLASVPTEKLRSVLREPMPDFANDPSFIAIVRERFGFSEAEIRQLGFGEALIRKIEASFTPAELEKIKEKNPDALDKMWREKLTERNWFLASLLYLPETGQRALSGMTLEEIKRLSRGLRDFAEGSRVMDMLKYPHFLIHEGYKNFTLDRANGGIGKPVPGHKPAVLSLLTELAERQPRGLAFADWMEIYRDLDRAEGIAPTALPTKLRASLADFFEKNLSQMPLAEQLKVLSRPSFLALLSSEKQGEYLARIYLSLVPPGATLAEKSRILEALQARVRLKDVSPEASRRLKLTVAEKLNLQPQEIKAFFPHEKFTPQDYSLHIRGASGIVSQVQTLPLEEQIYFIEYMLGREDKAPASIEKMAKDVREKVGSRIDFADMVIQVRARLMNESTMGRALAILPFYTGVNSILGHKGATDVLLDKILTGVSEQHRGLARELAHGIIASEGKNAPMAFAMIFAQGKSGVPLTEGEILRGLFSAYGVPGVKFAQYLAFTSEFKAVSEALASLQDQAMPLTYLEIVELLEKKFPDGLPDGLRVLGVKGSGSVNIGLEIFNPISGENEILSVPRENIRTATNQDFGRIRELIRRLTMTPEGKARYGFAVGLDRVIQKSVELEFNRPQVFENQKELSKIYNRKVDGWNIRMVAPYALEQDTIRMQKAQGVPARLVETDKPEVYRKAMKAASTVMMDHLLQKDGTSRHFADSDFHNGQAFIDEKTKTVWLIDPGQAIEINRKEFDLAKTILRLFSGTADEQNAIYELNTSILNPASRQNVQLVTKLEIAEIMKSGDIGDAFIKFVALVERKGGDMPLPIVQWILGMNRQLALGKKIGLNNEARLLLSFSQDTAQKLLRGGRGCGEDFAAIFRSLKDRLVPQR